MYNRVAILIYFLQNNTTHIWLWNGLILKDSQLSEPCKLKIWIFSRKTSVRTVFSLPLGTYLFFFLPFLLSFFFWIRHDRSGISPPQLLHPDLIFSSMWRRRAQREGIGRNKYCGKNINFCFVFSFLSVCFLPSPPHFSRFYYNYRRTIKKRAIFKYIHKIIHVGVCLVIINICGVINASDNPRMESFYDLSTSYKPHLIKATKKFSG